MVIIPSHFWNFPPKAPHAIAVMSSLPCYGWPRWCVPQPRVPTSRKRPDQRHLRWPTLKWMNMWAFTTKRAQHWAHGSYWRWLHACAPKRNSQPTWDDAWPTPPGISGWQQGASLVGAHNDEHMAVTDRSNTLGEQVWIQHPSAQADWSFKGQGHLTNAPGITENQLSEEELADLWSQPARCQHGWQRLRDQQCILGWSSSNIPVPTGPNQQSGKWWVQHMELNQHLREANNERGVNR